MMRKENQPRALKTIVLALGLCIMMSFAALAAETTKLISKEAAMDIAFKHATVTPSEATRSDARLVDRKDGKFYHVRFIHDKTAYIYVIDAETGTIKNHEKRARPEAKPTKELRDGKKWDKSADRTQNRRPAKDGERRPNPAQNNQAPSVTLEQAKAIALKDAGVSASAATFTEAKLENIRGRSMYRIEFTANEKPHRYFVDAKTGRFNKPGANRVKTKN